MTNATSHTPSLIFDDLGTLTDAFLLGGARLTAPTRVLHERFAGGPRPVRLQIARTRGHWGVLAWALIVLERNGLAMSLRSVEDDGAKLTYRSEPSTLLLRARHRWYGQEGGPWAGLRDAGADALESERHDSGGGGGGAVVPEDVRLDDQTLAVWLTSVLGGYRMVARCPAWAGRASEPAQDGAGAGVGLRGRAAPAEPLYLIAPAMDRPAAESLRTQLQARGWRVAIEGSDDDWWLSIDGNDRPNVEAWLERWVPRPVWRPNPTSDDGGEGGSWDGDDVTECC